MKVKAKAKTALLKNMMMMMMMTTKAKKKQMRLPTSLVPLLLLRRPRVVLFPRKTTSPKSKMKMKSKIINRRPGPSSHH